MNRMDLFDHPPPTGSAQWRAVLLLGPVRLLASDHLRSAFCMGCPSKVIDAPSLSRTGSIPILGRNPFRKEVPCSRHQLLLRSGVITSLRRAAKRVTRSSKTSSTPTAHTAVAYPDAVHPCTSSTEWRPSRRKEQTPKLYLCPLNTYHKYTL